VRWISLKAAQREERPSLVIPLTPTDRVVEFAAACGLALCILMAALYWRALPNSIPTHYGWKGEPNGWGPKWTMLLMPGFALVLYLLLSVLSRFPHRWNYPVAVTAENAERQYRIGLSAMRWMKASFCWLAADITWASIQVALHRQRGLDAGFFLLLALILGSAAIHVIAAYRAR
jgi:uncharacterized membrane protein